MHNHHKIKTNGFLLSVKVVREKMSNWSRTNDTLKMDFHCSFQNDNHWDVETIIITIGNILLSFGKWIIERKILLEHNKAGNKVGCGGFKVNAQHFYSPCSWFFLLTNLFPQFKTSPFLIYMSLVLLLSLGVWI